MKIYSRRHPVRVSMEFWRYKPESDARVMEKLSAIGISKNFLLVDYLGMSKEQLADNERLFMEEINELREDYDALERGDIQLKFDWDSLD